MSNILFPPEIYRWLVSIDVIPNQGILNEKNMVAISPSLAVHFQSGFNIGKIVSTILKRNGQKIPSSLESVKPDNSKNSRLTNWNFVWLSFQDLRMQFDSRIKDLILQGQVALIIQIIKQLYEKDQKKDTNKINEIKIKQKREKVERQQKQGNKHSTLDIRKLNLQKDPQQSESSLEFLILLLANSLNMTVEEILGLFTNQNKYLAHIIAKGLNDDFTAVILFYTLLNKYEAKLKKFCQDDPRDAQSCLYAIKPGFISKSQRVSELTVRIFSRVGNIYDWFISDDNRGATTLFLGIKRHPQLVDIYWELLTDIIQNEQIDFFTTHFKKSFRDPFEMIQTCLIFFQNLSESYLANKIMDVGVIAQWLEIAVGLYQDPLQFKMLSYKFIGQVMTFLPQAIQQNQQCLIIFRKNWQDHKITEFVFLIDQVILILQRLVEVKNTMARRMYQIIIQIFQLVSNIGHQDKKEYLVQNFNQILPNLPGIPSQFLIQTYTQQYIRPSDYILIRESVNCNNDINGLIRIGQVILRMFTRGPVVNGYQAPLLYKVCKKVSEDESGTMFIKKVIKDCLHQYGKTQLQKKPASIVVPQPMYFNRKGNSKKLAPQQTEKFYIQQKQTANLIQLIEKLIDFVKTLQNDHLLYQVKQDMLTANAFIRQNNYKIGSKQLSNLLQKKFAISKDEQLTYDDQYRVKKDAQLEQSMIKRKMANSIISNNGPVSKAGPQHLTRQFQEIADKRRKEQIAKKIQNEKKNKQQAYKKTLVKKQLQKVYLIKGFSGEVELKQQGFWEKLVKQDKQFQVIPPSAIEARDLQFIQNLFKRYHRVVRGLFLKYTSTMYWKTKSVSSFDDQYNRTEAISVVQLIKFLKDYKLFFLTSKQEVQSLTRDVNVKLFNRQQVTQQLDFQGFEVFIQQFCFLNFIRPHTIAVKTVNGNQESVKKDMKHLSYCHLIEQFFLYMRQVFQQKNQNTSLFDEPEAAYFNETEVIKQFNKKLEADPGFILPQGYKKITQKVITFNQNYSEKNSGIKQSYLDVLQVLDEILFESDLKIRLIQPMTVRTTKARVKPQAFTNVKAKLSQSMEGSKLKAFSTLAEKKTPNIPPVKMMQKKTLSFGMKLGLSYVPYRDKLLGEQVAYVIDDILDAVQKGRNTIQKQKVVNQIIRQRKQMQSRERKAQSQRQKKRKQRKQQLQKLKQQINDKKQKELQQTKEQRQKKKQKQQQRQKRKKEDIEKYLQQQKKKLKEKKQREQSEEKKRKEQESKKKKQGEQKNKEKFKNFNKKQIQKLKKGFEDEGTKKKKAVQEEEKQKQHKEEVYKKLRTRIQSQDNKIKQIKLRTNQQISQLYQSPPIQKIFRQFEPNLRALFDFLIKNTYTSLTERKHNNEIIYETWQYFNIAFQLNPLIVTPKNIMSIFKALTKDKQVSKQYYLGLNFAQFEQALLRIAIKHKSVFNKLAEKIKQQTMTQKQIDAVVQRDIEQKEKNQFEQPKQIDIKSLLKQQDVKKQIFDDYGDISKVDELTLKGLIYYLKVPKDKFNQEKRFRQILAQKVKHAVKTQKLKQKLNQQYAMPSPPKKKRVAKNPDNLKSEGGEGSQGGAIDSQ